VTCDNVEGPVGSPSRSLGFADLKCILQFGCARCAAPGVQGDFTLARLTHVGAPSWSPDHHPRALDRRSDGDGFLQTPPRKSLTPGFVSSWEISLIQTIQVQSKAVAIVRDMRTTFSKFSGLSIGSRGRTLSVQATERGALARLGIKEIRQC
jgi:hypothetical protein